MSTDAVIFRVVAIHPGITISELCQATGRSDETIRRTLNALKDRGDVIARGTHPRRWYSKNDPYTALYIAARDYLLGDASLDELEAAVKRVNAT